MEFIHIGIGFLVLFFIIFGRMAHNLYLDAKTGETDEERLKRSKAELKQSWNELLEFWRFK